MVHLLVIVSDFAETYVRQVECFGAETDEKGVGDG